MAKLHLGDDENGLEAWRALHERHDSRTLFVGNRNDDECVSDRTGERRRKFHQSSVSWTTRWDTSEGQEGADQFPTASTMVVLMSIVPCGGEVLHAVNSTSLSWMDHRAKIL